MKFERLLQVLLRMNRMTYLARTKDFAELVLCSEKVRLWEERGISIRRGCVVRGLPVPDSSSVIAKIGGEILGGETITIDIPFMKGPDGQYRLLPPRVLGSAQGVAAPLRSSEELERLIEDVVATHRSVVKTRTLETAGS